MEVTSEVLTAKLSEKLQASYVVSRSQIYPTVLLSMLQTSTVPFTISNCGLDTSGSPGIIQLAMLGSG